MYHSIFKLVLWKEYKYFSSIRIVLSCTNSLSVFIRANRCIMLWLQTIHNTLYGPLHNTQLCKTCMIILYSLTCVPSQACGNECWCSQIFMYVYTREITVSDVPTNFNILAEQNIMARTTLLYISNGKVYNTFLMDGRSSSIQVLIVVLILLSIGSIMLLVDCKPSYK